MKEYIGNAKIISPSELPKIGDKLYNGDSCVSVEYMDILPEDEFNYIFYRVEYVNPAEYFDSGINIYHYTYAISRNELVKFLKGE